MLFMIETPANPIPKTLSSTITGNIGQLVDSKIPLNTPNITKGIIA